MIKGWIQRISVTTREDGSRTSMVFSFTFTRGSQTQRDLS